jgi:hypothetical protein
LAAFFGVSASSFTENQGDSLRSDLEFQPNQAPGSVPGTKADHFRQFQRMFFAHRRLYWLTKTAKTSILGELHTAQIPY